MQIKELTITNSYYGQCVLSPAKSMDKFNLVLQSLQTNRSKDKVSSETFWQESSKQYAAILSNPEKQTLGFYEIYAKSEFLGIAGYLSNTGGNTYQEIYIQLLPAHRDKGLAREVIEALDADRKLYLLSEIIKKEHKKLAPRIHDMTLANAERTRLLWTTYFNKGILLSNGGVRRSFINPGELLENNTNVNLQSFNFYRSDRATSTILTQEQIRKFLREEGALSQHAGVEDMHFSFSLGAHEGFTRLTRCLYNHHNKEIFYPMGGYAPMAEGIAAMKPTPYKVHLLPTVDHDGGKICPKTILAASKAHPFCKTLYMELKTTAGAIYTAHELQQIIILCKRKGFFLIVDMAHINMHFHDNYKFPDITDLCHKHDFHDYATLFTCSKTYGLERGRIGFISISKKTSKVKALDYQIDEDLYAVLGSMDDMHFELIKALMGSELSNRQAHINQNIAELRFNMNLMLAYLEGVNSNKIDTDLRESIRAEISPNYRNGIKGVCCSYKPEAGIQMKVDISGLINKYFYNIKIFNSEMFCYALNIIGKVVSLHSYQILDPHGCSLRLSFSIKDDIHSGMQSMHDFVKMLKNYPTENRFLLGVLAEDLIFKRQHSHTRLTKNEAILFQLQCKNNFRKAKHNLVQDKALNATLDNAALKIQKTWQEYKQGKVQFPKARL